MEAINLTKIFKKYKNKWIALTEDNDVISAGKTLDSVIEKAKRKGIDNPITMRVPDPKCEFVLNAEFSTL